LFSSDLKLVALKSRDFQHEEPASLLVVTEHKIADLLLDKPEGVPATELATKSGLDAGKLTRILRLLATKHCFREGTQVLLFKSRS